MRVGGSAATIGPRGQGRGMAGLRSWIPSPAPPGRVARTKDGRTWLASRRRPPPARARARTRARPRARLKGYTSISHMVMVKKKKFDSKNLKNCFGSV